MGNGRNDATASTGDFLIARPFQPQFEFAGAIAAVDDMGVAIDEARRHQPAAQINSIQNREYLG